MDKIKRTNVRSGSGTRIFFKTVGIAVLCIVLVVIGYFAAMYISGRYY